MLSLFACKIRKYKVFGNKKTAWDTGGLKQTH
jgi:hypothetical protein